MNNQMSNQLPKAISKRIEDEALQYAKSIPDCMPHIAYRRGATEWAGKANPAIDALEQIQNSPTPHTVNEMEFWIEAARNAAATALAKYKEVANG